MRYSHDWKLSAPIETTVPSGMAPYGRLCGWTLARAHARSGDRVALATCLGAPTGSTKPARTSPKPTPTRTRTTSQPCRSP
ncbi:DUF2252 family protein [Kitasatospora sp. NPDC050467]|uniref:DUF2252 family protein n=1 Tax=Kitasatospora sp. NPDC050467 TaxID=3364053 RepID=UPI003796B1C5